MSLSKVVEEESPKGPIPLEIISCDVTTGASSAETCIYYSPLEMLEKEFLKNVKSVL